MAPFIDLSLDDMTCFSKHRGQNINHYALFIMFTHEFLTQPTVQYKHHVFGYGAAGDHRAVYVTTSPIFFSCHQFISSHVTSAPISICS
jgi:hypothetical protein